jgi:hypothetical protein
MKALRYVAYVVLILYVIISWANVPVPVLNPPNAPLPYRWLLTYPPSPPNVWNPQNATLDITADISASEAIADGVKITVSAVACMNKTFAAGLKTIVFGFLGAYYWPLYPQFYYSSSMAGAILDPTYTAHPSQWFCPQNTNTTMFGGDPRSIVFRKAGDYPASIQFQFANGTVREHTYQDFVLPVQSSEALRQGQINAAIGAATFAGFLFVVFELYPKLRITLDTPANRNAQDASD